MDTAPTDENEPTDGDTPSDDLLRHDTGRFGQRMISAEELEALEQEVE
jgi:hypothetical protein